MHRLFKKLFCYESSKKCGNNGIYVIMVNIEVDQRYFESFPVLHVGLSQNLFCVIIHENERHLQRV